MPAKKNGHAPAKPETPTIARLADYELRKLNDAIIDAGQMATGDPATVRSVFVAMRDIASKMRDENAQLRKAIEAMVK